MIEVQLNVWEILRHELNDLLSLVGNTKFLGNTMYICIKMGRIRFYVHSSAIWMIFRSLACILAEVLDTALAFRLGSMYRNQLRGGTNCGRYQFQLSSVLQQE